MEQRRIREGLLDAATGAPLPCQVSPELFWPISYTLMTLPAVQAAKALCQHCPVRPGCLEWALGHPKAAGTGIWGGQTPEERETT